MKIKRLAEEEVLQIRKQMAGMQIATHGAFGHVQPLHRDKLASAVFRQYTGSGDVYKYNTLSEVGATLFYGIAMSHAFENGNKRTALVCLLVFLDKNKAYLVGTTEDEIYDLAKSVAAHEIPIPEGTARTSDAEVTAIAQWIREKSRARVLGDTKVKWVDFKRLLEVQGCHFHNPDRNFIKITRERYSVKIGYPNKHFEVAVGEVKRVRSALKLNERQGIDSAAFYDLEKSVDAHVNAYRNLLKRLADL
ncbi:type II toxin-antitoxin system death-on-curing family toxin [Achromobacter xylosoxidans]|uniref:type II toxin-antitoxin system death-on-curing family toxin n=1 Tax=Alcaligenes xylosoxydans xylosoxydans TaxID=85698 RepID=UPI001EEEB819|nr:type II toxin-antitoxin system death-on-curing family toxin [Achromobacter xylosoxidans]MCZ8393456.1 type II toxin-antitoxin system death-on-curing family toxin [Achromobacter xylosoxidans]